MASFTMTHDINCSVEEFWQGFLDPEFNRQLYNQELRFSKYEVVEQKEEGNQVKRTVEAKPPLNMPGPVAKALGEGFGYREIGTLDRSKSTYEWRWVTSALTDKLSVEGTMKVEPAGDQRCKRVVTIRIGAKIFGVGGLIESAAEKNMREGWDASAAFTNRYAASKRG
ncbi:MAG TPA: DUF2505 domain-containing protein [Polyangiaceae bacterium]|nr:DUF2505 domain-containing protein [Polyangiaceae bacterium]